MEPEEGVKAKSKQKGYWELYRTRLHCKIGRDKIDGGTDTMGVPPGVSGTEYSFFLLFNALDDLAAALQKIHGLEEETKS